VSSKTDDEANNMEKNFGTATFYKYATQLGFPAIATVDDLAKMKAVNNGTMLVRVKFHKLDIATTYLDATVAKGGAAAVKLAKDEIEKFRKYYYTARAELKAMKEQLEAASSTANTLQSKQGKFQMELEPLQMALQAKTEAAETLLTDLESERNRANGLKRDLDKARESLGFMSMLWLESTKHVSNDSVLPSSASATVVASNGPSRHSDSHLADTNGFVLPTNTTPSEASTMAQLDITNTLREIVEETGSISSKQLRKEYKKKKGTSLKAALRTLGLGTPLAFLEANMGIFSFEEPTITLKPKKQINVNISQADVTSMAVKSTPSQESLSFLTDAHEFVNKILPQVLPLPITSIFLSGAAGKGVSLAGSNSVDVVVFLDKVPDHGHGAWVPPILTQMQRVLKVKLPSATELAVSDHCVHFSFEGASINLYPTSQFSSTETMYDTIIKYPNGWYDAATAHQQVEFIKGQSSAVKSIIRIAQTWNNASPRPVSSYLIELLSVYACTPKTSGASFEPLSALSRLFETISDFENVRIFWERFYPMSIVPASVFREQPLVLDPANPVNNMAKGIDVQAFKLRAKEVLDSGFTSLLPFFS
jgi:hypothetical protein